MKVINYLSLLTCTLFVATTISAHAEGDAEKGKKNFKKCVSCHSIEEGKKKVGPSLFKIINRQAGTVEKYRYSKDLKAAGEKGLKWTPENLIAYLEDPKKYVAKYLDKKRAKTKMFQKFKKLEVRQNIAAYLVSLQPELKKEAAENNEAKTEEATKKTAETEKTEADKPAEKK